jgi:Carboxypeptidase regulatory-like domain/TonB dependent receptor
MFSFIRVVVLLILFTAATIASLGAQNVVVTGAITGRVTDSSEAVVRGANLIVLNSETGVRQSTVTNAVGIYRFVLSPGTYTITVSHNGFRPMLVDQVRVLIGNTTEQDIQLQVGASDDAITVIASNPLLRQTESSQTTVIGRALLEDLPLSGRRYTDFTLLSPNASADGPLGLVSIAGEQGGEDSGYANGNGSNFFTVDGTSATNNYFGNARGGTRIPYTFGEEAVQEFQVAENPYSAVYGGGGTGFINTITRSGGNDFHGSAFYYNRNSATAANDALDKASGYPKPQDELQQFGASLGGPILPNRLWFFFDYEQQIQNAPISVINQPIVQADETSFGLPAGTPLPPHDGPLPVPGNDSAPDPQNPVYLQQVSNTLNALDSNLGVKPSQHNDLAFFTRLDYRPSPRDNLFLSLNLNHFNSPAGVITQSPVSEYGTQALANAYVRDYQASFSWNYAFTSNLLNEFHFGASSDNQFATPTGLIDPSLPTFVLANPTSFTFGNAGFSSGQVFEKQWGLADRLNRVTGKHTLQFGFDMNWTWVADHYFGGFDPDATLQFGTFRGTYYFDNLTDFALGEYSLFNQASGNPTFAFTVPYCGFYVQDTYRVLPNLTLEFGLREDFQVYPQPRENPAFPLTGQYPNQYLRLAPRFGFSWQPKQKTVVRGGFGQFFDTMNGLNYRNAVVSNGLASQQSTVNASFNPNLAPNQQTASIGPDGTIYGPTFPSSIASSPLFQASPDISLVAPQFRVPYVMEGSLQIEQEILPDTTVSIGTMWTHGVHLISGSAYDANLLPLQGTTTYIICPPGTVVAPCSGRTIVLPNMDSGLLQEGRINRNLGQINELISPGQNQYNSLFVQLKRQMSQGLSLQFSYTLAKNMVWDGVDFNNQFDFSDTHSPSLLDQRHRISFAGVYQPGLERFANGNFQRALASGWTMSSVMQFSSGRPYAGLLSPACTSVSGVLNFSDCTGADGNLNDTAFNQATANTALGINGAGPTPGIGLNFFYGPWVEEIDLAIGRTFQIKENHTVQLQVQAFNLFNHANFYVQNGDGVNQAQYNPIGTSQGRYPCGDGVSLYQTCFLVPNAGPGNFGTLQEINPLNPPRVLQFAIKYNF